MRTVWHALGLAACLAGGAGAQVLPAEGPGSGAARLVRNLWHAQESLSYRGSRVYFFDFGQDRGAHREDVAVRTGTETKLEFSLRFVELLDGREPGGLAANANLTRALFAMRAGSNFKYRDFRIHDRDLALQNYWFLPAGWTRVAERECEIWFVVPRLLDRRGWVIWADRETGLVLRYREYTPEGVQVAGLEYDPGTLTQGRAADFKGVDGWWRSSQLSVETFASLAEAEKALGHPALLPTYLPPGFRLQEIRVNRGQDGQENLVLVYTDGLDLLFLVNGTPARDVGTPSGPAMTLEGQPIVHRFALGPVEQLWCQIQGRQVMLIGRICRGELPLTFESLLAAHLR